jgi:hypothetical protein
MTSENLCAGCRQNCCAGFFVNPRAVPELPSYFRIWQYDRVNLYCQCGKFDAENGVCKDYEHRPEICRRTGENGKVPHKDCLLGAINLSDESEAL